MNREILYRGKDADNLAWREGLPARSTEPPYRICAISLPGKQTLVQIDPDTLGQFTGLTDKFDEKVFEGDYVFDEVLEEIGIVEFDEGEFVVRFGDVVDGNRFADVIASCHVIGNIHDNPELLGGD